jgi:hypothetical protein
MVLPARLKKEKEENELVRLPAIPCAAREKTINE